MTGNPMQALCGAHCRTTGQPCKNHKMNNGRCRMHGGKGLGRPVKHGYFTKEALEERGRLLALNRAIRAQLKELKS
jgi:hypothetical protein